MKAKRARIKAVEMVRRIRDEHYEQLRDKSPGERIAFYRDKARRFQADIRPSLPRTASQRTPITRAERSKQ